MSPSDRPHPTSPSSTRRSPLSGDRRTMVPYAGLALQCDNASAYASTRADMCPPFVLSRRSCAGLLPVVHFTYEECALLERQR